MKAYVCVCAYIHTMEYTYIYIYTRPQIPSCASPHAILIHIFMYLYMIMHTYIRMNNHRFPPAPRLGDGYAILTATDIAHGYEAEGRQKLFDDVQLTVEKGDRVAILGPNGCGKSTFLRLVVGKVCMRVYMHSMCVHM